MNLTKWLLLIGGIIVFFIVALAVSLYMIFRSNPSYVLEHLEKHPDNSSLYVAVNGEEKVAYEAEVPRPLASVSKILIAIEYAYQVENGQVSKEDTVSLETLKQFYIKDTDGGAHEAWLEDMEEQNKIHNESVHLQDVASGMITFSSNANADYLIDLLGADQIDKRMNQLGLSHDPIMPFVGALTAVSEYKNTHQNGEEELAGMSEKSYRALAFENSQKLKQEKIDRESVLELSLDAQRIWSDRLPNAPATTYGQLLHQIATNEFPSEVTDTIRNLLEWPMEKVEGNQELYHAVGAKGGSTAFVFNQAMYVEDLEGTQFEIILFTDDLSFWQSFMLQNQTNNFILEIINSDNFLNEVKNTLTEHS